MTQAKLDQKNAFNSEANKSEGNWGLVKKYWYLVTLIVPMVLLVSSSLAVASGNGAWLWSLAIVFWVIIPVVDHIFGEDPYNPSPEEEEKLTEEGSYYRGILYAATMMQWASLVAATYAFTQLEFSWFMAIGAVLSVGAMHAVGLTMSHELGHKMNDRMQVFFAKVCSAVSGYAHFNIEHNKGHHKDVATPDDPASSRMGENIYRFALREIPGAAKRGWSLEAARLKRQNKSVFSLENELLQITMFTVIGYAGMTYFFGLAALPFLLITGAYGWFQLTMANYIEHYGLLRQKLESGRYERCQPRHSWNTNYKASNLLTLHLQRHSDHHAHPTRPYQLLRDFAEAPSLPQGYPAMMGLALFPAAWRKVMDHRVVEWAEGDMTKVNIDPKYHDKMFRQFHNPSEPKIIEAAA